MLKSEKICKILIKSSVLTVLLLSATVLMNAQTFFSSPANWMFPNGTSEALKQQKTKSGLQSPGKFEVKWFSNSIYGNVQPLIGNIINNPKTDPANPYAPNEIISAIGGKIVLIDATGKTHKTNNYPMPLVKNISMLYNPNSATAGTNSNDILDIGIESIEHQSLFDSLTFAFIGRYDLMTDTVQIIRRLALDIRQFPKNTFASITPVFGKILGSDQVIYALVNMTKPKIDTSLANRNQFFRGIAMFNTADSLPAYPINDIGDDTNNRVLLGPIVSLSQPSLYNDGTSSMMLLPTYCDIDTSNSYKFEIANRLAQKTMTNNPYLLGYNITAKDITVNGELDLASLIDSNSSKPIIKQYYTDYDDINGNPGLIKLVTEEYTGLDGSIGTAKIHLYDPTNFPITSPSTPDLTAIIGRKNHGWSVAIGNVDGNSTNDWLPYYPNNPGPEIIVTHTTRTQAVAQSRLMILRYRASVSNPVPKVSPPNSFLKQFDTVATQQINGWIAAVNDLDGSPDGKDEILLVDGSNLNVLRLKNYRDVTFRSGRVFDTVYSAVFPNETIFSAEISDIDGDGKNDIIATTNMGTYMIGAQQPGLIKILKPKSPPSTFCEGEKVDIQWYSKQKFQKGVEVKFIPIIGGSLISDSSISLATIIPELKDTDQVSFIVDKNFIGKSGVFAITAIGSKTTSDTSAIFTFNGKSFSVDTFWNNDYRAGEDIFLNCKSSCYSKVTFQFRIDSAWIKLTEFNPAPIDSFRLQTIAPCIDGYLCALADTNVSIDIRYIVDNPVKSDTSASHKIKILPATFPVTWDSNTTACPTKVFQWRYPDFPFPCDTIEVLASYDDGKNYSSVGSARALDQQFIWRVPTNMPDSIKFRFCAVNSCMRHDTVVAGYKAQYVSIVAPNPLNPTRDLLEIVYSVPQQSKVEIKILDESNRLVKYLIQSQSRDANTVYCDKWDGTMTDGSIVANGMYYICLEVSGNHREIYPVFVRK